ncbi:MAG: iron chelate uptake ABC transporter family permease subunit [Treponema sp.]|jgi:iron complex transport system permease protein|nr:iron chelate uptake ABC transporter family permease subunit [Treponema sp.]
MGNRGKLLAAGAAAFLVFCAGTSLGSSSISPVETVRIVFGFTGGLDARSVAIVRQLRLPRALLAFMAGGALSLSGAVFQPLLKNQLASPYIVGVSSGASLGAALVILAGFSLPLLGAYTLPAVGLAGGLLTVFLVFSFSSRLDRAMSNNTIILFGMVVSLFVNALLTTLMALHREELKTLVIWQMGSFALKGWSYIFLMLPFLGVGILGVLRYTRELDLLSFGEEDAFSAGVEIRTVRGWLFFFSAVLTGAAVALSGAVGFVDLIAPHTARRIVGSRHRYSLPMSFLLGGSLMVAADLVARVVVSPSELPVGAVTALIGAPFFAWVYFRRGGASSLLRFAHKTPKNRLIGDFLPCKLRKEPDNRDFCGTKYHKNSQVQEAPRMPAGAGRPFALPGGRRRMAAISGTPAGTISGGIAAGTERPLAAPASPEPAGRILSIRDLRAGYGGVDVIRNISLEVRPGEVFCIAGPNGSGKSTLLRAAARLIPYRGEVRIGGLNIAGLKRKELARKTALLGQMSQLWFPYTVYDTVALGRYAHSGERWVWGFIKSLSPEDRAAVENILERLKLADIRDRLITELSGGQLQRVFLARTLVQDPAIILLDEPTNHLDLRHQVELLDYLSGWARENRRAVAAVLHDLNLVNRFADRMVLLDKGEIAAAGTGRDLLGNAAAGALETAYGIDIRGFMRESLRRWEP